jgi:hypothetical protein
MSIHFDLAKIFSQITLVHNLNHIQNLGRRLLNFFKKKYFVTPLFLTFVAKFLDFFFK